MKIKNNIFNRLIGYKNRLISLEREKNRALFETNSILSAYIAVLLDGKGSVRISRKQIRDSIGRYAAKVITDGEEYIISVLSDRGSSHTENQEKVEDHG